MFDTIDECLDILRNITPEKYSQMLPYIQENFAIAQQYDVLKIDENNVIPFEISTGIQSLLK